MAAAVQAKKISDMIMSMESERPRFFPVSGPTAVGPRYCSRGPSKPPYEPLRSWLLIMASAGRCSELLALVFDPQYIHFKPNGAGVTLHFTPEFRWEIRGLTRLVTCGTFQR